MPQWQRELKKPKPGLACFLFFFKGEPHLDLIAYSQVGHTNFCYKYCALMIDIAHGEGTDQAKQMDFQLWSQKAGGKEEEKREGWCLVLSEWTNWSRTGGRERKHAPWGTPPPHTITCTTTIPQQHRLILTQLAGVPSAFMWLLVLHSANLSHHQCELLWLCVRLICCPSQYYCCLCLSVLVLLDFHLKLNLRQSCQKFENSPRRDWNLKQKPKRK